MTELRFKPAYNPYTEPSLEIFAFHKGNQLLIFILVNIIIIIFIINIIIKGLKKWVEVGNSGVFRPEMLLPMKLPKDVTVFGWGLSLERLLNN
jgi:phenylalanyl-tRNA synthetase alpha chain